MLKSSHVILVAKIHYPPPHPKVGIWSIFEEISFKSIVTTKLNDK